MMAGASDGRERGLQALLSALHRGEVSFGQFERATRREWERMAASLLRHRPHPPSVTEDDVMQEMLFSAWRHATRMDSKRWDPGRGVPLHRHVLWNVYREAERYLNKARYAVQHGSACRNSSRYELAFSTLARGGAEDSEADDLVERLLVDEELPAGPRPTLMLLLRLAPDAVGANLHRLALRRLAEAEGDVARAAALLWGCAEDRIEHEIDSEDHAERIVASAIRQLARELAVECEEEG